MEILEYFDEYKEPWRILSRDMNENLAKAYIDKLCYNKDSSLLEGADKAEVLRRISSTIGIGRMKTFVHTLVSYMQMKHLAVDTALARVECEKFYVENKEGSRKRSTRQHTAIDDRMDGVFAALKADSNNTLDFSLLNKLSPEERTYRTHCIALKLFCTLWMKCYLSNPVEAGNILPIEFKAYTANNNGRSIIFYPPKLFETLIKSTDKTAASLGIDETSITYFLTADKVDMGLYANLNIIETVWNNLLGAPTARKYLEALCNHIADITSPTTEETDAELVKCYRDYDMLTTLHDLAQFTSIDGCRYALTTDAVKRSKEKQEQIAVFLNSLDDIDFDVQQLQISNHHLGDSDINVATLIYGDAPFIFTLDELEDRLVDQVAIIPVMVDKGDKTYAVCECEYEDFVKDPDNSSYWQPADDLLYFKYIKQQARYIQPQRYDVAQYLVKPDAKFDDSYVENLGASLINPSLYCHKCGRLMLPTSNFMTKLSLAARNDQISTGGQLSSAPLKNSEGFILNHTANAIAQKMTDINRNSINRDVSAISWPEVVAVGSKYDIEYTNVFVQPAYADYFMQISNAVTMTRANQVAAKLESDIAKIVEAGRRAHLGYSKIDYLYTLVSLCDNAKITMKVLALQSRVYYGAETMLAYIHQIKAAVNSSLYDTNIYDKIDMPFGYANIRPLIDCVFTPAYCLEKFGFSSFEDLIATINVSNSTYSLRHTDAIVDALKSEVFMVPVDPDISVEQYEAMGKPSDIDVKRVEIEPGRAAILCALQPLEEFYTDLSQMAHAERECFFKTISEVQNSVEKIIALCDATDVDNMLSSAEMSILNRSMADIEFWETVDSDKYNRVIAEMAESLPYSEISSKSAVVGRTIVDNLLSSDKQAMAIELNAEAIGRIIVDPATELPSLNCLHQRFSVNPENTYEHMVATYLSACGMLEDTGAFLADEAADFAIKIYYECVVNDAVSTIIKKNIANNVTTESYYCTGGFEQ